ncbi:class I SAM-dependent methyltransferase, partial [bacterium]|nr:class I SAM-dependent methyltransferase [bacterium]
GAEVTATDISLNALELLARSVTEQQGRGRLRTEKADMEKLPFAAGSFDLVVSAGSLSYGEPSQVDREVRRVLAPGGSVVCVDSLNHNPIYRFNRWVHYLRGERTRSTLSRMPTIPRLEALADGFRESEMHFFGSVSWAMGPLARLTGESMASAWSDRIDRWVHVRASAFKVVLAARHLA